MHNLTVYNYELVMKWNYVVTTTTNFRTYSLHLKENPYHLAVVPLPTLPIL